MTALPFGNTIASYTATGMEITEMIKGVAQQKNLKSGNIIISLPQWAGLKYTFSTTKSPRVQKIEIAGKLLVDSKKYTIITNDFTANGGDNIITPVTFTTGKVLADVVIECLKRKKTITPTLAGNVVQH
jgi:2',3'-cyclic-nucleotide 2'-phosphodiesterase (5'-nucleotidase family)